MRTGISRLCLLAVLLIPVMLTSCGGGSSAQPPANTTPSINSVTLSCPEPSLSQGLVERCTASVQGSGAFDASVRWSVSSGTIVDGFFTAPVAPGNVVVSASSIADPTKSASTTIAILPATKASFEYNGINHVSWWIDEYLNPTAATAENELAATGANHAGVLVTQYMPTSSSTVIAPTQRTPSDAAIAQAIQRLHDAGLKVMLKPHVDVADGTWRGSITPVDTDAWFASYKEFIVHYAELAQTNAVEMFCIGTELKTMSGAANLAHWAEIIRAVRAVYGGKLTYAANAVGAGDEFTSIAFWDQLDVIGLDGYFPLTNVNEPSISQLVSAWSSNSAGQNIVALVTNFANAHPTKPVIFTEIGYRSVVGANKAPFEFSQTGTTSVIEQQNCYEAMYKVWAQPGSAIKGAMWWAWPVPPPSVNDTDYNPRNKPAQTVLENWQ